MTCIRRVISRSGPERTYPFRYETAGQVRRASGVRATTRRDARDSVRGKNGSGGRVAASIRIDARLRRISTDRPMLYVTNADNS